MNSIHCSSITLSPFIIMPKSVRWSLDVEVSGVLADSGVLAELINGVFCSVLNVEGMFEPKDKELAIGCGCCIDCCWLSGSGCNWSSRLFGTWGYDNWVLN